MRHWIAVLVSLLIAGAVVVAVSRKSHARWSERYASQSEDIKTWFKQQYNSKGQWCCDESDGHPYYGDYTVNPDGSVTLDDGRRLPPEIVLKGKNPTGHAVYWYIEAGGNRRDYCFSPGTMG